MSIGTFKVGGDGKGRVKAVPHSAERSSRSRAIAEKSVRRRNGWSSVCDSSQALATHRQKEETDDDLVNRRQPRCAVEDQPGRLGEQRNAI